MPRFRGKLTFGEHVTDVDGHYALQESRGKRLTGSFTLPVKEASAVLQSRQCRLDIDGGMSINILVPKLHVVSGASPVSVPFVSKGRPLDAGK